MKVRFFPPILFAGVLLAGAEARAQDALTKQSPFTPQSGSAAGPAASTETIELAGVVGTVGQKTDLIFYDKTTKKSRWVTVGGTAEGITVVSYDPQREQAVVKINGEQKTFALRKSTGPKSVPVVALASPVNAAPAPMPAPATTPLPTMPPPGPTGDPAAAPPAPPPAAPAAPLTPEAKQEQEARMLVSDLLEIGMAQRKAYEEAQRKAAEGGTPPPANSQPPLSPSGEPKPPAEGAPPSAR